MKNVAAILFILYVIVYGAGCAPETGFNEVLTAEMRWGLRWDFSKGPMTVGYKGLTPEQASTLFAAINETNRVVGFEVFKIVAKKPYAMVTAVAPKEGRIAETELFNERCELRMDDIAGPEGVSSYQHELLHCVFGDTHSKDPESLYYPYLISGIDQHLTEDDIKKFWDARQKGLESN